MVVLVNAAQVVLENHVLTIASVPREKPVVKELLNVYIYVYIYIYICIYIYAICVYIYICVCVCVCVCCAIQLTSIHPIHEPWNLEKKLFKELIRNYLINSFIHKCFKLLCTLGTSGFKVGPI